MGCTKTRLKNNCIKNIRTLRRTNSDSDHLLVGFWMKVKLKKITNCKLTKRNINNINKFSGKRICKKYKCKIENNLKENQDANYKRSTGTTQGYFK